MDLRRCPCVLLFGGSFDPPHVAHHRLPLLAMKAVGAQAVAYIPAAVSPFKTGAPPTAAHHRVAMLRAMLADEPDAVVLTDEIERYERTGRPSYTIDTVTALRERLGEGVRLRLLIGADQLASFDRWRDWRRIVELAEPAVMVRPPATRDSMLASLPDEFDAEEWRSRMIDLPVIDVSATLIRDRLAKRESIEDLVDEPVRRYIEANGLYR